MKVSASLIVTAWLASQHAAWAADPAQRPVAGRTQSDQTVTVQKGMRLDLSSCTGGVTIRTWDRDAVRVRADHPARAKIGATARDQTLVIEAEPASPRMIDYDLTVPAWMGIRLEGRLCAADVGGLAGTLAVEGISGDLVLRDVTGAIDAKTADGNITVEGARGRVQLHSFGGNIDVRRSSGEIVIETIDGDVKISDALSPAVEISTVEGDITFSSALQATGRYLFTTHDGAIVLALPDNASATVGIRSYGGGPPDSAFPLKATTEPRRGRRTTYTLGTGSAEVEIETFEGSIHLRKK
jgi:hypothetical protein